MTSISLRPKTGLYESFAQGSTPNGAAAVKASSAVAAESSASAAAAPGGATSSASSASSASAAAPTHAYDKATLIAISQDPAFECMLPVELSTSTLEVVKNQLNADIEKAEGSVWGRHVKEDLKPAKKAGKDGDAGGVDVPAPKASADAAGAKAPAATEAVKALDAEKSKRAIKSILNKLSATTFDKLTEQLMTECALTDNGVIEALVSMVFDKAAYEAQYVGVYADLCAKLYATLGSGFKKTLISAAQDEFENSTLARETLGAVADRGDRDAQAKRARSKIVGVMRLVGELFKRSVVGAALAHAIAAELLGEPRSVPCDDYIEALCALLTASGGELEAHAKTNKAVMDMYFARLNVFAESMEIDTRTRFACRDVIELRSNAWVARSNKVIAASGKKASDELDLTSCPAVSDEILFPEGPSNSANARSGPLEGPYEKPTHAVVLPTVTARAVLEDDMRRDAKARAEAKADAAIDAVLSGGSSGASSSAYDAEQVEQKINSFIDEYATVGDISEALLCIADLIARTPDKEETKNAIAKALVDYVVNVSNAKIADAVGKLLAACFTSGGFDTSTLEMSIGDVVSMLDDVAIDVPMAPKLLAKVVAKVVAANAVALDFITAAGSGIEDVMYRREFCGAALVELKESNYPGLKPGALDLHGFAAGEPGVDDTVTEWLGSLSLSELA